jgi:hypothetical protein
MKKKIQERQKEANAENRDEREADIREGSLKRCRNLKRQRQEETVFWRKTYEEEDLREADKREGRLKRSRT